MLDIIEFMESSAERRLYDMTEGLPQGKFRCGCGAITDFKDAQPASANPYSDPVCPKCLEDILGNNNE